MKFDKETKEPIFDSLSELLLFSSDAIKRLIKKTNEATRSYDTVGREIILGQKAIYMAYKIPQNIEAFESYKENVPKEVKKQIKELAHTTIEAVKSKNYTQIDRLLRENRSQDMQGNILEQLAGKYQDNKKLDVWDSFADNF